MRRGLASAVLAAFAVLVVPGTAPAVETHAVSIAGYAYAPAAMTVRVGDVVTWTNSDQAPHDVAAGTFRSPMLQTGQSWSYTFTQPGTFDYVCSIHPDMRARITVLAPETAAPAPEPVRTTTTTTSEPTPATTTSAVVATAAPEPQAPSLQPMLLLAGLVAAVTTLCLLLIGSRPDRAQNFNAPATTNVEVGEGTDPA